MSKVYLDHAATTPVSPEAVAAMEPYIKDRFGNPSALYSIGREARRAVEKARSQVSSLIGASREEVFFTSGGTESNNMALWGALLAAGVENGRVLTTAIEHHAILETCSFLSRCGFGVDTVGVDSRGKVEPEDIRKGIRPDTVLVSVMHANNEVGTIEPLSEVSKICRQAGVIFHTDAVQTVGNIPVDVDRVGVDVLSMSGHKLYGPKGVGAIYIRNGTGVDGVLRGGEQERGMRAGTENVMGIVGLGAAAEVARSQVDTSVTRIRELRDRLVDGVLGSIDGVCLNGHPKERLPNNAHFGVSYVEGEAICLQLDALGICASTGSACSSEALEPSHVLLAMGMLREEAQGSVRFTLGRDTTEEDIDFVLEQMPGVVERLRAMSPFTPR